MSFPKKQVYDFLTFISTDITGEIGADFEKYIDVLKLFLEEDPRIIEYYDHFIKVVIMPDDFHKFPSVSQLLKCIYNIKNKSERKDLEFLLTYSIWAMIWH